MNSNMVQSFPNGFILNFQQSEVLVLLYSAFYSILIFHLWFCVVFLSLSHAWSTKIISLFTITDQYSERLHNSGETRQGSNIFCCWIKTRSIVHKILKKHFFLCPPIRCIFSLPFWRKHSQGISHFIS